MLFPGLLWFLWFGKYKSRSVSFCFFQSESLDTVSSVGSLQVPPNGPLSLEYVLEQGGRVCQWLKDSGMGADLDNIWNLVKKFITDNAKMVISAILAHPYSALGIAIVVAVAVYFLIKHFSNKADKHSFKLNLLAPPSMRCPITNLLMIHPVITPAGHTYERDAIMKWIAEKGTDYISLTYLNVNQLIPNRILEVIISNWIKEQKEDQE